MKDPHFTLSPDPEPHKDRNTAILAQHPEIKELYGPDWRLCPAILAIAGGQLGLAYCARDWSWPVWFLAAYVVGGTLCHWLSLGNHELSHNLCFAKTEYNVVLGLLANVVQGVPSFSGFCHYHKRHHYFQGDVVKDVDIATEWEGRLFQSRLGKALWLFLMPFFYGLRPLLVNPKPLTVLDVINVVTTFGGNIVLAYYWGYRVPLFSLISDWLGHGLHPVAGHFIAEHFVFTNNNNEDQETYSYYGPLNLVAFNVGYHNEHHDFPRVSGLKLPQVHKLAPEFYEPLASYQSWSKVLWDFVMLPEMGPCSRVLRAESLKAAAEK